MTDDSFIREVNEELRSEQVRAVWRRFGPVLIGGAVAVVIGTAGYVGYEYWRESKAAVSGDQFLTALDLAGEKKTDEALSALKKLETEGAGSYPVLAQLRTATLLEQKKDMAGAVTAFDAVAADSKAPVALRDVAKLRAAYILVDTGSYEDVAQRAETLSADGNPMRGSAREVLGLAAYKAGRADDARKLFQQNADDAAIPVNLRQRANTMLDLMRSSETAAKG
ncbi:tetratricopeptide repeat protein [Pseudochrobactrum sp. B5]|uniref:tetratricopeptide repeat protein n=1 Tax=Pseudochrobactrum sp. B5 TaxID=1289478 RepID=UPI000952A019|nr:tetratricopeptide repeat protein [Pseudochrobactrum sp. B5]